MKRIDSINYGYSEIEVGLKVAPASVSALSIGINAEVVHITAWNANTDTVWFAHTSTANSGTGYPLFSGSVIELRYRETPLYFQSQGGSSVVSYIALGKGS